MLATNREQAEYELRRAEHNYRVAETVLDEAKKRLSDAVWAYECWAQDPEKQEKQA